MYTYNQLQEHYADDTSGIGQTLWMVILGRAISGIGGAGIMTVSSIIITGMSSKCLTQITTNTVRHRP